MPAMPTYPPGDAEAYKSVARTWAATVTVVTARRGDDAVAAGAAPLDGFTATAFLTVSIDPPLVLVSVMRSSGGVALLRDSVGFAVSLLAPHHSDLANAFARPQAERAPLWEQVAWQPDQSGVPILDGSTGAFSARATQFIEAGDHVLVLGEVTAIHRFEGSETLVYHDRAYGSVRKH
jgi:flavin reductase (DIM6/NTAB) family NADH-FMN oxidoreductase RutF